MARRRRIRRRISISTLLVRLVILLVVATIVLALVARWWVEKEVSEELDRWIGQTAAFGELRYLDVSAGFDGTLTIKGLSFYPSGAADFPPLISEKVTLTYPDFLSLLGLGREGPPRRLSALIEGVRLDVGIGGRTVSGNPFEALACGDVDELTQFDLEQMGFFSPRVSIRAGYELRPAANQAAIFATQSTGDFARIEMELNASVPGLQQAMRDVRGTELVQGARIAGWRLAVDAVQFNPARNEYCAEQLDVSSEAAVDANVEATLAYLAETGWVPSGALVEQYRAFLLGQGEWVFSAQPAEPVDPQALIGLDPPTLIGRMDIQATIAGGPSAPVEIAAVAEEEAEEFDQGGEIVAGGERRARWRTVTIDELDQYVGRNVLIATRQRKRYSGRLLEMDETEVRIRTRITGGTATVPIARSQITEIRVYR